MKETGKCPNCGAEIIRGTQIKQYYCLNCGAALDVERKRKEATVRQRKRRVQDVKESPPSASFSKLFSGVRERVRDKTRDNICAGLQRLGIDAQMAKRGYREEDIVDGVYHNSESLGLIDIPQGPINWVNVRRERHGSGDSSYTEYYTDYGVPDPRLSPSSPKYRIETVRVKAFPLFGRVRDLHWEGKEFGLGITYLLENDISLKQPIMKSPDVVIRAHGDQGYWIISTKTREVPSRELWDCYQAIARHLLSAPL